MSEETQQVVEQPAAPAPVNDTPQTEAPAEVLQESAPAEAPAEADASQEQPQVVAPKEGAEEKPKRKRGRPKKEKSEKEEEKPEKNVPVVVEGKALDVWQDAASTFVPALRKDMTPEQRREAVRDVAHKATEIDDRLNLVLGELLFEVAENGYHKAWPNPETGKPFETFEEYVQIELNMQKSKAHYLKKIYKVFVVDLALPTDTLRDIEWSKAKELTDVVTKENASELLAKVKSLSVRQVKDMVAQLKGKPAPSAAAPSTPDESKVRMVFQLAPEQAENVQNALKVAESMTASAVPANNLDLICTDFMAGAGTGGLSGVMSSLDRNIQALERAYGIKLTVADHDKDRYDKLKAAEAAQKEDAQKEEAKPA